jgi:hypothetical protein
MEATAAWGILVVTVPSIGMMGSWSPPLVHSGRCGGDNNVEEPVSVGFQGGLARSSEEWRRVWHW